VIKEEDRARTLPLIWWSKTTMPCYNYGLSGQQVIDMPVDE
jgi:hypothetical protein